MKIYEVYYTVHLLNISISSFPWPPHPRDNWSYLPAVSAPELQRPAANTACWIPVGCYPLQESKEVAYMGGSIFMTFYGGSPIAGWFISWKILRWIRWMIWRSPILGNLHISRHISTVEDHSQLEEFHVWTSHPVSSHRATNGFNPSSSG